MRGSKKEKNPLAALPGFAPTHILVHYDEIALKGRNRGRFERALVENLRAALRGRSAAQVQAAHGRLIAELAAGADIDACLSCIGRVFGVSRYSPAVRMEGDLGEIKRFLDPLLSSARGERTFRITCNRVNKQLPFTSTDVNRELGTYVEEVTGWAVRLEGPDLTIHVHLVGHRAFVALQKLVGPGGLPAGASGKVVCLLSGGIDSPVAAYRMLCRGASTAFVHFHSAPHTSALSQDKARELAGRLLSPGQSAPLWMVPFGELQQRIVVGCPPKLRVVLYRRFMVRAAEDIARSEGALALVTGESLGQVASQTLENLRTIDEVATLPILRPLVGMPKREIIDVARRIDTYETSIEPHEDCCSFLMPRHPATATIPAQLEEAERAFDVAREVAALVRGADREEVRGEA